MARPKKEDFNQIKYQNEFNKANYDRVEVNMPKGKVSVPFGAFFISNPLSQNPYFSYSKSIICG